MRFCSSWLLLSLLSINLVSANDTVIKSTEVSDGRQTIKYEIESVIRSPMKTLGKNAFRTSKIIK